MTERNLFLCEVAICTCIHVGAEYGFVLIEPVIALLIYALLFSFVHVYLQNRYSNLIVWMLVPVVSSVLNYAIIWMLRPEMFDNYPGTGHDYFNMEFWLRFIYASFITILPIAFFLILKAYKMFFIRR